MTLIQHHQLEELNHLRRRVEQLEADNVELAHKAQLYEKLRRLNPRQYRELWLNNLAGQGPFDELVEKL